MFDSRNLQAIVKVYRLDDITKKWAFHARLAPSEATEDRVAELFGGGHFRGQLFEPDERGSMVIRKTVSFFIPGVYRPPMELPGVPAKPLVSTQDGGAPVAGVPLHGMSASETLNTALVSQVIELMKASREPTKENPLLAAILPKALEVLGQMMLQRGKGGEDTVTALLAQQQSDIKELRALLAAKPEPPVKSLKDTIEDVLSIRQLLDQGAEKAPDSESMMWAAGLKALEAMSAAKPMAPEAAVASQQVALANPNIPAWRKILMAQKKRILMAAQFGLDPYYAADAAVKMMVPHMHGAVMEFLKKPDHVELAMQEIPELRGYENWVTEFFASAHELFFGDDGDNDNEEEGEADAEHHD